VIAVLFSWTGGTIIFAGAEIWLHSLIFLGETMDSYTESDKKRFGKQLLAVVNAISQGSWMTLEDIAEKAGVRNPSSVASRIRDLKASHGWNYERRKTQIEGLYEYRAWIVQTGQLNLFGATHDSQGEARQGA
jgi:hypothetical protein